MQFLYSFASRRYPAWAKGLTSEIMREAGVHWDKVILAAHLDTVTRVIQNSLAGLLGGAAKRNERAAQGVVLKAG